jgi:hypothetical protein
VNWCISTILARLLNCLAKSTGYRGYLAAENRSVGGSTPSPGTINSLKNTYFCFCGLAVFNPVCNFGVIESDGQRDALLKVVHSGINMFAIRMSIARHHS